MITIRETLAGEPIRFHCIESLDDTKQLRRFVRKFRTLAIDTESTGLNCYRPGWKLRTAQIGNANTSFVIPAQFYQLIEWVMEQEITLIGHNGPHDIRCIDQYLGYETNVVCAGETYIPSHHLDSRNKSEGGIGHALKELSIALVDPHAGRWETELKRAFKEITIPMEGQFYKSGPKKGQPKTRKAKIAEGWSLIDPWHPAYIAYAAADPILTYRVWKKLQPIVRQFHELYQFDHQVQLACDTLQRRALTLDVEYTERLGKAYTRRADQAAQVAASFGCDNPQSGQQVAQVLEHLGATLREHTKKTGQPKTDATTLRKLMRDESPAVQEFINAILINKQLTKRRKAYVEAMLAERDSNDRVHPSINSIAARTARMSISDPPLQQLPTADREQELELEW